MKQSTSSTNNNTQCSLSSSSSFVDDEREVAGILIQLQNLASKSESRYRFAVRWGARRKRSGIDLDPSPLLPIIKAKAKAEASSPATPLSFSPSESDGKSNHSHRKTSKKRTREEWMELIDGLVQSRELLRGEIENAKSYYNKLKAFNLELKAKKEELTFCLRNPHFEITRSMNFGSQHKFQSNQDLHQIHFMIHQKPFIIDQTAYNRSYPGGNFQYPYGQLPAFSSTSSGLGNANHVGPLEIPDLNVAAEENFGMGNSQPLDHSRSLAGNRAKAADARRRRMDKIREKKPFCHH